MKSLAQQARECVGKNYGKSAQTNIKLFSELSNIGRFLQERYGLREIGNTKSHMVRTFFRERLDAGQRSSTLTGYATAWRQLANAIGKNNMVPRTNDELGIARASTERYAPKIADGNKLDEIREALVARAAKSDNPADKALVAAFDIRAAFGVRSNESLMSKVIERDSKLSLEVHGAKGGRPRTVEAANEQQQAALEQHRSISKEILSRSGNLIPPEFATARMMYDYQRNVIRSHGGTKSAGANMHLQRHAHIQSRISAGEAKENINPDIGHGDTRSLAHYAHT